MPLSWVCVHAPLHKGGVVTVGLGVSLYAPQSCICVAQYNMSDVQGAEGATKCYQTAAAPLSGWGGSQGGAPSWDPYPQHSHPSSGKTMLLLLEWHGIGNDCAIDDKMGTTPMLGTLVSSVPKQPCHMAMSHCYVTWLKH